MCGRKAYAEAGMVGSNAAEAILKGRTFSTESIEGADAVKIVQQMCLRTVDAD